jgi:hypothetical protein
METFPEKCILICCLCIAIRIMYDDTETPCIYSNEATGWIFRRKWNILRCEIDPPCCVMDSDEMNQSLGGKTVVTRG